MEEFQPHFGGKADVTAIVILLIIGLLVGAIIGSISIYNRIQHERTGQEQISRMIL